MHDMKENSPTSIAHNSISKSPNDFKFATVWYMVEIA